MNSNLLLPLLNYSPSLIHDSIFGHLYIYYKDINSDYIDCNENVAIACGLDSTNDMKNKSDKSFGWSKQRIQLLREWDLQVIKGHETICMLEQPFLTFSGETLTLLSYKFPLFDKAKIIGICGAS